MTLQILYVDTLFFVNFALDLLSLVLAGILLHLNKSLPRLLLASFLGAVYAVLAVFFSFHPLIHIFISVILSFLVVSVAYRGFGSKLRFGGAVCAFYLASVLLGGAIEALFGAMESLLSMRSDFTLRASDVVLLLGFISFGIITLAVRFFSGTPLRSVIGVRVRFGKGTAALTLLVDSGCFLADPISGKPALLVRLEAVSEILPGEIVACARSKDAYMPRDPDNARRCRLIPAESFDGRRLLLSVRADMISTLPEKKGKGKESVIDAYLALYSTEKSRFGGFDGLFPASILPMR